MQFIDPATQNRWEERLKDTAAQAQRNPAMAAAIVGGAAAAAAGAVWGARALRRRGNERAGEPHNAVMQTALTASELAEARMPTEPRAPAEPRTRMEPKVEIRPAG